MCATLCPHHRDQYPVRANQSLAWATLLAVATAGWLTGLLRFALAFVHGSPCGFCFRSVAAGDLPGLLLLPNCTVAWSGRCSEPACQLLVTFDTRPCAFLLSMLVGIWQQTPFRNLPRTPLELQLVDGAPETLARCPGRCTRPCRQLRTECPCSQDVCCQALPESAAGE